MSARRTGGPTSNDLLSAAANKPHSNEMVAPERQAFPDPASPPRYLLPKDLPGALARLDIREIASLLAALVDEARRRGRLTPTLREKLLAAARGADEMPKARTSARPAPPGRPQGPDANDAASLTIGKTNAVRAAFMAGIKPATIARQFGISQSAVRQALASDAPLRKP